MTTVAGCANVRISLHRIVGLFPSWTALFVVVLLKVVLVWFGMGSLPVEWGGIE